MGQQPNWSQEEIDYLHDKWGETSVKSISNRLNRSVNAINVMKNRLGLGAFLEGGDYITFNQLLLALGFTGGTGYCNVSWLKNRNFPIKYKKVNSCSFKIVYIEDFWKWAYKNRTMVNWSKVEVNILGAEPMWVKGQRETDYLKSKFKLTPWTKFEDEMLKNLLKQFKYGYPEISKKLQRTEGAVQRRILDLNLKERPIKADNHIKWTDDEYSKLVELIKQGLSYELMSDVLGKSSKAIRGRVYNMYLSENLDKVRLLVGKGTWGDGRPERSISSRLLDIDEKKQVKENISLFAGLLKRQVCDYYNDNDYWQRGLCKNWDDGCVVGELNCDNCISFARIQPQYCRRCGSTFYSRKQSDMCEKCLIARKKQHQKKYMTLQSLKK